jgi:putative molybdopterin biosynthesis protein
MHKEFRSLLSINEAQSIVLDRLPIIDKEKVCLDNAFRRILAEKIVSKIDVPNFNRASMDGYAVRSQDTLEAREDRPICLRHAGCVPVGAVPEVEVEPGETIEVSTGSMMPNNSDSVIMIEHSEASEGYVLVRRPVHIGENVQELGSDIMLGEAVLFPGVIITAREIGVLAAMGHKEVLVKRLIVGLASTGNELVSQGTPLKPGQIYDVNSHSIASAIEACGGTPVKYGILHDKRKAMIDTLLRMSHECSMILLSGSTSAGKGDMIYKILDEVGETIFHGVNLKPGKPTIFGIIEGKPVIGLPGYPTSALTVFSLLVAPSIRKALGLKSRRDVIHGRMTRPVRSEGRHQMLSVGFIRGLVYPVDKGSGSITTLSQADGVIEIPADVEYLERGEEVEVQLFEELFEPDLIFAGENCPALEMMAEALPYQIRFIPNGAQGVAFLEDGLVDMACVSRQVADGLNIHQKFVLLGGYTQELGLMSRDDILLQPENMTNRCIQGWSRDSDIREILLSSLKDIGVDSKVLKFIGQARTHSAVAASVASGKTDLGFGERSAAEFNKLAFRRLAWNRVELIVARSSLEEEAMKAFISYFMSTQQKE